MTRAGLRNKKVGRYTRDSGSESERGDIDGTPKRRFTEVEVYQVPISPRIALHEPRGPELQRTDSRGRSLRERSSPWGRSDLGRECPPSRSESCMNQIRRHGSLGPGLRPVFPVSTTRRDSTRSRRSPHLFPVTLGTSPGLSRPRTVEGGDGYPRQEKVEPGHTPLGEVPNKFSTIDRRRTWDSHGCLDHRGLYVRAPQSYPSPTGGGGRG